MSHPTPDHSPMATTQQLPLSNGMVAIVDVVDYESLSILKWYATRYGNVWYAATHGVAVENKRGFCLMHRYILGVSNGEFVDHIDRNGLNNSRSNLRLATKQQNGWNRSMQANNTSGYKGVFYYRRYGKWQAKIACKGKQFYLGYFETPEEAASAYNNAAIELHGEFAWLNKIGESQNE